ncbi:prolyl oligopeptidase family serine peptidase [Aestuariibacter sp. AA17]|uniref:Prolyl oligopeptidase family serine peptidase n=1 Tax=Fluctibacter corallii TaxID=2984329 RepID=A0ABT3ABD7_9ALTE|nr:prolyl oligopeptidase family serine peptidase [Aestuariibacter sp. AA17]MCV2885978.1 prolyl oligopeptidase family serine peptidase [Aestuariibacter sp. AA17]
MKSILAGVSLAATVFTLSATETRTLNNGNLVLEGIPPIPKSTVEALNQYQNVRSAPFRAFTQDGDSIYISTRFGDVSQLHKVNMPGGARQQLTFFKEPIGSIQRQPDSDRIAFTMDAGGSENAQIFILDPSSGTTKMISDGESRNGVIEWSKTGGLLAFQSTKRNGRSNDIWIKNTTSDTDASLALASEDGSWWGPIAFSQDNQTLLVQQYVSASDSRTYLVDIKNQNKTLLDGNATNVSTNFALALDKKDTGYFFSTNQNGEFSQLAYREFASNKLTIITKDIPWDVDGFALSHDGTKAAFALNEDGMNTVYLLDTATFKYEKVKGLPVGLVGGLTFSPDDTKLGMTLNTAKTPSDSFLLALGKKPLEYGKLVRWTFSEVGGLDTDKFFEPTLVRYPSFDNRDIPAFVYKPDTKQDKPFPVIISIHGGPEAQFQPAFRSTFQLWMDKLGAAVIAPNVRGSSGYGKEYINLDNGFQREDSVKDIGALLDWIATQPDLDENRVAVFGGSYGGYMVLASAVHYSDRLNAAVDIVGISNFVTFLKNTKDYRRDLRRVEYGDERDPKMHDFLQRISPNNNVDKINIPMFVVQGENDPRVPVTEAEQIVKALRDNGKSVWYMNALNEGHGYRKKENKDVYQQAVVLFFEEFL